MRSAVVGFDGSAGSVAALEYAARRVGEGGTVVVVYAEPPAQAQIDAGLGAPLPFLPEAVQPPAPSPPGHAVFNDLTADTMAGAHLERVVVGDRPARALIEVARERDADEIVIGTRRHGRVRAAIASTSHDLIHDTDRPVVIVPPPDSVPPAA